MRLCTGCPRIYHISILIGHFQFCSRQFFTCSKVRFCDFKDCCLIFKGILKSNFRHIRSGILESKFFDFFCSNKTCRCFYFFHIEAATHGKICSKEDFSILVRRFLFNNRMCFYKHITVSILNIFFCTKGKYTALQHTVRIFFFFGYDYFCFLAAVLPFRIVSYHRSILVTVGQINVPRLSIQNKSIGCFFFYHIIFSKRQIIASCKTKFIGCDCCYQFILFVIIITFSVSGFNVFSGINFKGNVFQRACYIIPDGIHCSCNHVIPGHFT